MQVRYCRRRDFSIRTFEVVTWACLPERIPFCATDEQAASGECYVLVDEEFLDKLYRDIEASYPKPRDVTRLHAAIRAYYELRGT